MRTAILFLLAGMIFPVFAADDHQSLEDIRQAARAFVTAHLQAPPEHSRITVGQLDTRLRLADCDAPLSAFLPSGTVRAGNLTVGVRCGGNRRWKLYVPVSVDLIAPVVVLARPVTLGSPLTAADLRLEERAINRLSSGYYSDPQPLIGKLVKSSMAMGRILNPLLVTSPRLVRRGEKVTLRASIGGIDIRVRGKALADGGHGDRIRVRNLSSEQVVEGTVTAPGQVSVRL